MRLRILDVSGRQVRLLENRRLEAGVREASWDGKDDRGQSVPAGVYLYELATSGYRTARRLVRPR